MQKRLLALAMVSIAFAVNTAVAKEDADSARRWKTFQTSVGKCDALSGADQKKCLSTARKTYRSSHFDCSTMAPRDKAECQKYHDEWISAAGSNGTQSNAPAVRAGEPNTVPADPGNATDKERNRDSTKQDASTPAPKKL